MQVLMASGTGRRVACVFKLQSTSKILWENGEYLSHFKCLSFNTDI